MVPTVTIITPNKTKAAQKNDPELKQGYRLMEERWLGLAGCYSHPESINALRAAIALRADKR
jgi:hypothetical protein